MLVDILLEVVTEATHEMSDLTVQLGFAVFHVIFMLRPTWYMNKGIDKEHNVNQVHYHCLSRVAKHEIWWRVAHEPLNESQRGTISSIANNQDVAMSQSINNSLRQLPHLSVAVLCVCYVQNPHESTYDGLSHSIHRWRCCRQMDLSYVREQRYWSKHVIQLDACRYTSSAHYVQFFGIVSWFLVK
jgi:hypothetical protein